MGAVERTLIMKLQGTILVLAVLVGQLQCAPSGCRGSEWDNTGHSSGHTTGQSKRSGDPADTDALLPQNWWESKEPMGDGAVNVKRADTADTGAIVPTGPSNQPMGDAAVNAKRSGAEPRGCRGCEWDDTENPSGPPQETKRSDPSDTGAISVKRSPMSDSNPADNLFYPSDDGFSTSGEGDAAINVKRSGAEPRGCRDCEWADTGNPSGPRNEAEPRRLSEGSDGPNGPFGPPPIYSEDKRGIENSTNPRFYPCEGP